MGQDGPKMGSKRPLASILNRFWMGFARVSGGFGMVLGGSWKDVNGIL